MLLAQWKEIPEGLVLVQRGINNPPAKKVKTNGKLRVNQIIGS
jgi:hypothetical protein